MKEKLNIFIGFVVIPFLVLCYGKAHPVQSPLKIDVAKAQSIVEASPTPTATPVCPTSTPYDTLIEKYFKDSCSAKRILRWVDSTGHVYGENTLFITADADVQNKNGSWDRGLFRINDRTFAGYLKRMPKLMKENGLSTYDDMLDVEKNIRMASIIYTYQGACAWFAAPPSMCSRNYPGVSEL